MTLLVDIGNSRVKWGRLGRAGDIVVGEAVTSDTATLAADLDRVWGVTPRPPAVLVCNVAGLAIEQKLVGWVRKNWDIDPQLMRTAAEDFGLVNGYAEPGRLGVDRWVGLVGVRARFGFPACLVDCGTAVTVDLVDAQGCHRGGLIAPGLRLMRDGLQARARGIGAQQAGPLSDFWGRDTGEGIDGGVLQMVVGLIERALRHARCDLGRDPVLVLTGGDAPVVSAQLSMPYRLAPDIVLYGLAQYAVVAGTCPAG